MNSVIYLIEEDVSEYLDVFLCLMLDASRDTLLPELYNIFGKDKLMKFLDIFSGSTFKVPPRDVVKNMVRDADIYHHLSNRSESVTSLSKKHNISAVRVSGIYDRVKKTYEEGNFMSLLERSSNE